MPIFEYKCEECGAVFEKLVHSSDEKVECDKCSSDHVDKLFSSFAAKISPSGAAVGNSCSVSNCSACCPNGSCGI